MANWFVGLPVEGSWLEGLIADAPPHVRRFAPEDVHMTVAFFGPVGEERAMRAWQLVARHRGPAVAATLGGLAAMGNPRRPSALSLLLTEGHDRAVALLSALRDPLLEAAGARPETREPKPHVTVARPNRTASPRQRKEAIAWALAKAPLNAPVVFDTIALYTWSGDRAVRQFEVVARRRLDHEE